MEPADDPGHGSPSSSVAILVATCRRYAFILDAFLTLWRRYWPQCPWPLYVSSDSDLALHAARHSIVPLVRAGDDGFLESWLDALEALSEDIVLLVQEDFLLERPVDDACMRSLAQAMSADPSILCIRTMPWPAPRGPRRRLGETEAAQIETHEQWAFSWQSALWRRHALIAFLRHRLAIGSERVARHLREHPELTAADLSHRVPRPAPDAYAWFNPEWHGHEFAELYPDGVLLGVLPRAAGDPEAMLTSPLPYWPTAIVGGELKHRAQVLLRREGIPVRAPRLESALRAITRKARHHGYHALRAAWRALVPSPLRQGIAREPGV